MEDKILEVNDLRIYFDRAAGIVRAVSGVTFNIRKGEVFGLVGESGSGKTLTALSVLKLITPPGRIAGGEILFNGIDLLGLDEKELRAIRGSKIGIVFQEPSSALNPVFTVGYQIAESVLAHRKLNKLKAKDIAIEFLYNVRIDSPEKVYHDYPHQLSGGTKQRAMIAMALVNSPELLILDEPTTALDVTIQSQILDLLEGIIENAGISVLFISHDFGVIARMCDRVGVMHKGRVVETDDKDRLLQNPKEAYTISLLESVKALSWI